MKNFINNTILERIRDYTLPGTTTISTAVVNCDSSKSVSFHIEMGAVADGEISIQLKGSKTSAAPVDLINLNAPVVQVLDESTDQSKTFAIEYNAPMYQYLQLEISRVGNQGIDSIMCFKHNPRFKPVHNEDCTLIVLAEPV